MDKDKPKLGHSFFHKGLESRMISDSWLSSVIRVSAAPNLHWPTNPCSKLREFANYAYEHILRAIADRNFSELNLAIQTQYTMQIVNEASHVPVRPGICSRVYSTKPFIIEFLGIPV